MKRNLRAVKAAAYLYAAMRERKALGELPDLCRPRSSAEAYAIQDCLVAMIGTPVGYKIAFTNNGIQRQMGVSEPAAGRLIKSRVFDSPAEVEVSRLFRIGIESEFAFFMAHDLPGTSAPYSREAVVEAIDVLLPAIEIVDTRYVDWGKCGVLQAIADNVFGSHWIAGEVIQDWRSLDLSVAEVVTRINGLEAARGIGANVFDHPFDALTWLANDLAKRGLGLCAGEVVTTGSATSIVMARPGDIAVADFGPLGSVSVALIDD